MDAEKPTPERSRRETARRMTLDDVWPVRGVDAWPEDLSLRREDLYDDRIGSPEPLAPDRGGVDLTDS